MKKLIFMITAAGLMVAAILPGCNSPSKKVENAQENLDQAKQELDRHQKDSILEFLAFKKESEDRISENEKMIESFKARVATDKKQMKETDRKIVDGLEQKIINMRKKMEEYKEKGNDDWAAFKVEFNHDMDELGKDIKNLGVKNTK